MEQGLGKLLFSQQVSWQQDKKNLWLVRQLVENTHTPATARVGAPKQKRFGVASQLGEDDVENRSGRKAARRRFASRSVGTIQEQW